jgi:hypothetical protein
MNGLTARAGLLLDFLGSLSCRTDGGAVSTIPIDIGGPGGSPIALTCPASRPFVTGLLVQSGARIDGVALECSP